MMTHKKHKYRLKETSFLLLILLVSFLSTYLTINSNFLTNIEDLQEDQDNYNNFDSINNLKLSLLGEDVWWNSSWQCRMLINVTNPYPYDFENYGVSITFDYTSLGQKIQSSLDDIRIVENGILRNYYVKKDYPITSMATVWFDTNINDTVAGDDIEMDTYMYFGNEDAQNAESSLMILLIQSMDIQIQGLLMRILSV